MSAIKDFLLGLLALILPGFGAPTELVYNGYVEADYVYVAPSGAGRIVSILAAEGDRVAEGQLLLTLEDTAQVQALRSAEAGVAVARANLDNLQTGSREAEIAVIRASLHKAYADQKLAETTLERSTALLERGLVPPAQVDTDRANLSRAEAQIEQLQAQLKVAELPARDAQRLAAEGTLDMAKAQAAIAKSNLDDRTIEAPIAGVVDRIYFDAGEVAATGAPVLSIFPPDRIKAIFFIPEPARAGTRIGDILDVTCDGCDEGITARITYMASDPQYTPPIIYSREERARLVFRAEALLQHADGLLPGQPVTLRPAP